MYVLLLYTCSYISKRCSTVVSGMSLQLFSSCSMYFPVLSVNHTSLQTTDSTLTYLLTYSLGTCESEIFLRIESRIESTATIRIRIESGCNRLRVQ